jgi:hypothetical protein
MQKTMKYFRILILFILTTWIKTSVGCVCDTPSPVDTLFKRASVVFEGVLIKETGRSNFYNNGGRAFEIANFKITNDFKGVGNIGDTISIFYLGSDCDEHFTEKGKYIIFGFSIGLGFQSTSICLGNLFETNNGYKAEIEKLKSLKDKEALRKTGSNNFVPPPPPNYVTVEDSVLINIKRSHKDYALLILTNEKLHFWNNVLIYSLLILTVILTIVIYKNKKHRAQTGKRPRQ